MGRSLFIVALLSFSVSTLVAKEIQIHNGVISVRMNAAEGSYAVFFQPTGWEFRGSLGGPLGNVMVRHGNDAAGRYEEITFAWPRPRTLTGSIRVYNARNAVLFSEAATESLDVAPPPFPILRGIPTALHLLTYSEHEFGVPPVFGAVGERVGTSAGVHSGPIVLFDDSVSTCIVSPASDFMVAALTETGKGELSSGLLPTVRDVPAGYSYKTVLVWDRGVNAAWETWGHFLTDLYKKKRPANDADVGLRYLGYWTDNGATYYYNYDTTKGYEGTLLSEKRHLESINIPIRYLQLDSWWYLKGFIPPDGRPPERNESKTPRLPAGEWNRYGGLLEYVPAPELFPGGLKAFRDSLGVPLITHNRWIEGDSPYRREYRISGIGAVDPRWWEKIVSNIKAWGVATYEQDWLNMIYRYSPEFSTTTWAGEKFLDEMSAACARHGVTMQYCMPLPRHYLAGGARYSNLTSIRVSGDRFNREKWKEFLYGSRLASALGVWPWADVFMSTERENLLLATLSAGMVGIGDKYGSENPSNIAYAVRPDGVIVKPDVSLVPTDATVLADAKGTPACRTAFAFSQDSGSRGSGKAIYLFSYNDAKESREVLTRPADLGLNGRVFAYDFMAGTGRVMNATDSLPVLSSGATSYTVIVPLSPSGVALAGDPAKFVMRGKQRFAWVRNTPDGVAASVKFVGDETTIDLSGYSPARPRTEAKGGTARILSYTPESGQFTIELTKDTKRSSRPDHSNSLTTVEVVIRSQSGR